MNDEARAITTVSREPDGKWKPGASPNPSGRPKADTEIRELARAHGAEAIKRLVELMRSDDEQIAISACRVLLDRGYGRVPLSVSADGGPLVQVNLGEPITNAAQAAQIYARLMGNPSIPLDGISFVEPAAIEHGESQ